MRKTLIILLLILNIACSVQRIGKKIASETDDINVIRGETELKNINREDFIIEKGEIILQSDAVRKRYSFSIKHNKPDTYVVSVKNSLGLEGARIYLNKDTLLINDRLNKRVLYGKPENLSKYYGIPAAFLNILFGNVLNSSTVTDERIKEEKNSILIIQNVTGIIIETRIDGKNRNIRECTYKSRTNEEFLRIRFSNYFNKKYNVPGIVEIINKKESTYVKVRIYKFTAPWDGQAVFIPGAGYIEEEIR